MRCLFAVSSWFVQCASLTVNIDLSDVINEYYTVLYRTVVVYEKKNRSLVSSGSRKKSQPSVPPFSGKLGKPPFPLERWALRLGFFCLHWTPMMDSIYPTWTLMVDCYNFTQAILPSLSREGYIHWLYWSSSDVIVMFKCCHHVQLHLNLFRDTWKLIVK